MNPYITQQALQKLVSECPVCHTNTLPLEVKVINQTTEAELVHVTCNSCQGALVALIFSTGAMVSSVGLITDLSPEDVAAIQHTEMLTEEDILDLHITLRTKDVCTELLTNA